MEAWEPGTQSQTLFFWQILFYEQMSIFIAGTYVARLLSGKQSLTALEKVGGELRGKFMFELFEMHGKLMMELLPGGNACKRDLG